MSSFSGRPEPCTKWTYDVQRERWSSEPSTVVVHPTRLGEGGMRVCNRMDEVYADGARSSFVVKFYKPELRAREEDVFNEAVVQYVADTFAQDYNRQATPKKVAFLACYVIRLTSRPGQPLCFAEPFLPGRFAKHSNNAGGNFSRDPTPAAFSHFTYESSNHLLLVCDIQGVGEFYTDPQIHSYDGQGFAFGNLGHRGIDRFLASHRCNDICRALKLPPVKSPQRASGGQSDFGPLMMAPMGFASMDDHMPLARIFQMLHQMPMGQGMYEGSLQTMGRVLDGQRGRTPMPGRVMHVAPSPAEDHELQVALRRSLSEAKSIEDKQLEQAMRESLADQKQPARGLRQLLHAGAPVSRKSHR